MAKKIYSAVNHNNKSLNYIFIALITAFMLVIPFYRGLFFRVNYLPAIIFISIVFTAYLASKYKDREYETMHTFMDVSVLLIPAAYLISFFFAANAKDAADMLLIYCSYFLLYKLVSEISMKNEKYKSIFIKAILFSSFLVSFASMLHVAGIININGVLIDKRLYGVYQYANTTASVLGVGIILSLNKLMSEKNTIIAVVYQLMLTSLTSSFILTLSRGGYLVLAGILLLNFLLVNARAKLKMVLGLVIALLSSSALIYKFYTLPQKNLSGVWIYYLLSLIVSGAIIYGVYILKNRIKLSLSDKSINLALIATAVVFIGVAAFLFIAKEPIEYKLEHKATQESSMNYKDINIYEVGPSSNYTLEFDVKASVESPSSYGTIIRSFNTDNERTEIFKHFEPTGPMFVHKSFNFSTLENTDGISVRLFNYESASQTVYRNIVIKDSNGTVIKKMEKFKYIPPVIANRLTDINLTTKSVSERLYFTKDGLKIIKDYPIAGAGGGAWRNLYKQYQSVPYNTTEVHNFYVQYGTEVGIIGLAVLIVLLIMLIISMIKSIKAGSPYLCVYLAVLLLFLHSSIDFNLSLTSVGYILWMLVGIINSDKNTPSMEKHSQKYITALVLVLSLAVFIASSSIYYGMKLGVQAAVTSQKGKDPDKAIELYEAAARLDKYNAVYRVDMAQIMNNQLKKTKDMKYYNGVIDQISLVRKYEPYNHKYTPTICNLLLAIGKFEEASMLAEDKLKDEPMLEQSYSIKINVNYEIATYDVKNKKVQEAIPYLKKVVETKDNLEAMNTKLKEPLKLAGDDPKKIEAAAKTLDMIEAEQKK